ncbi:hypothetical protein Mapa_007712 [Marchantia paleacea]|nr:hypothetical protein Mapa_007712 [Marchantia paleacea]
MEGRMFIREVNCIATPSQFHLHSVPLGLPAPLVHIHEPVHGSADSTARPVERRDAVVPGFGLPLASGRRGAAQAAVVHILHIQSQQPRAQGHILVHIPLQNLLVRSDVLRQVPRQPVELPRRVHEVLVPEFPVLRLVVLDAAVREHGSRFHAPDVHRGLVAMGGERLRQHAHIGVNVVVDLDVELGVPERDGGGEENLRLGRQFEVALDVLDAEEVVVLVVFGVQGAVENAAADGPVPDHEAHHDALLLLQLPQLLPRRHPRLPHRVPPLPAAERRVDADHHERLFGRPPCRLVPALNVIHHLLLLLLRLHGLLLLLRRRGRLPEGVFRLLEFQGGGQFGFQREHGFVQGADRGMQLRDVGENLLGVVRVFGGAELVIVVHVLLGLDLLHEKFLELAHLLLHQLRRGRPHSCGRRPHLAREQGPHPEAPDAQHHHPFRAQRPRSYRRRRRHFPNSSPPARRASCGC